ncbi:TM2 domain-containing protein [Deinococcus sp.]|uniref:TM2 domain-containing protein n=1 Tax=Deinococcus sp. TaxID=47478 RepID=UPI003CC5B9CC
MTKDAANDADRFGDQVPGHGEGGERISLDKASFDRAATVIAPDPAGMSPGSPQSPGSHSVGSPPSASPSVTSDWRDTARDAGQSLQGGLNAIQSQGDVAQKKLIAGLLGIFLGSLGIHKFYLGISTPGVVVLAINIGGWIIATLLTAISLGILGLVLVPLMFLVSSVLGIIGLIEGILYLTKTDPDFQRDYVIGKKPWF